MKRLTKDDVKEMGMLELSHNQVFVKDREAWYRDYDMEITARDLAKAMFARNGIECPSQNEEFDEYMFELLQDGYETLDGMIALYYNALWSMADIRERLKAYEDTGLEPEEVLSSDELREINIKLGELIDYRNLEEQGRLIKLPCKVGDTVYVLRLDIEVIEEGEIYNFIKYRFAVMMRISMGEHRMTEININDIGRIIFLTREEAEKALDGVK